MFQNTVTGDSITPLSLLLYAAGIENCPSGATTPSSMASFWICAVICLRSAGSVERANCRRRASISGTSGQPAHDLRPAAASVVLPNGSPLVARMLYVEKMFQPPSDGGFWLPCWVTTVCQTMVDRKSVV